MNRAFYWRMNSKTEPSFNIKVKRINHSPLAYSNSTVTQTSYQKHHSVILDSELIFDGH